MYLKKVNIIYENIQKEGRTWQKIKSAFTSSYKDIGKKIGGSIKELMFQETKSACKYLIKKYFPKIKINQLRQVILTCENEQRIKFNDQTEIAEINKGYFCAELLKLICSNIKIPDEKDDDPELTKAISKINAGEYSPFYDVDRDNPSDKGTQLADQCINKYGIQQKLNQAEFEPMEDPYKPSILHKIKQIKLV